MSKNRYESPKFRFQELFLFEGVAATCWGYHRAYVHIWYDEDNDGAYDAGEHTFYENTFTPDSGEGNGCSKVSDHIQEWVNSNSLQSAFTGWWEKYWDPSIYTTILEAPNAGDSASVLVPIHS